MIDLPAALREVVADPAQPPGALDLDRCVAAGTRLRRRRQVLHVGGVAAVVAVVAVGSATLLAALAPDAAPPAAPTTSTAPHHLALPLPVPTVSPMPAVSRTAVDLDLVTCPDPATDQRFRAMTDPRGGSFATPSDPLADRVADTVVASAVLHALRCALPPTQAALLAPETGWTFDPQAVNDVPLAGGGVVRIGWTIGRSWENAEGDAGGTHVDSQSQDFPTAAQSPGLSFDDGTWDWRRPEAGELWSRPRVGVPAAWGLTRRQQAWTAYLVTEALVDTGVLPGDRRR